MIFHKSDYSVIAKERLKLMLESDSLEQTNGDLVRLKKEITALVNRYFDIPADKFEVQITLKQNKKRV